MLTTPRTAEEALQRLSPDIQELFECIGNSLLGYHERARLAHMIAAHFAELAGTYTRPRLRLVVDRRGSG